MGATLIGNTITLTIASIPLTADFLEKYPAAWLHSLLSPITHGR